MLTISSLVEAVFWIAVAGENDHFVTQVLESDGGIDDESLGTANAEIRVQEYYCFGLLLWSHFRGHVVGMFEA
jgi:hypothetical protein